MYVSVFGIVNWAMEHYQSANDRDPRRVETMKSWLELCEVGYAFLRGVKMGVHKNIFAVGR